MCEIQVVYRFGKSVKKRDYKVFKNLLNLGSRTNNDAHGYLQLTKDTVYMDKRRNLKSLFKHLDYYKDTKALIGHNRFATCVGKKYKDNHPFCIESKYYWVHNGVLYNSDSLIEKYHLPTHSDTDSEVIGELINHFVTKENDTVQEAIAETIKELKGSFSVVFYDLKTGKIYYFKDDSTNFFFGLNSDNVLYGTTVKSNLDLPTTRKGLVKAWEYELIPEPYAIYEFTHKGLKIIEKVEVEEEIKIYREDDFDWEDRDWYKDDKIGTCEWCGKEHVPLEYSEKYSVYMCELCTEEEEIAESYDYDDKIIDREDKEDAERYTKQMEQYLR